MDGARSSLNSGFSALGTALKNHQQARSDAFDFRQEDIAARFMDRVEQAQTPEEIAALRNNEELMNLKSQLRGENLAGVRGALNTREGAAIDQISKRDSHFDEQTMRELRPQMRQWQAQALQGDDSWINEAAQAGITDDDALKELYGHFTAGMTEQRAQEQNDRSWISTRLAQAQDARSAEAHSARMTDWNQGQETKAQQNAINRALIERIQDSDGSTLDRQALIKDLQQQFPEAKPETWTNLRSSWDDVTAGRYQMSEADAQDWQQIEAGLDAQYNIHVNPIKQAESAQQNSYDVASEIVASNSGEGGYFSIESNEDVAADARKKIMEVISSGIDVDGLKVPVPPAAIDMALKNSGDAWFELDHKFDQALKEILQGEAFKEALNNYAQHRDRVAVEEQKFRTQRTGRNQ